MIEAICPPMHAPSVPLPVVPAKTYFAPAGRDGPEEFCRRSQLVQQTCVLRQALDAMPNMVMILNENRQIVSANEALLTVLDAVLEQVLRKRPGEAVGCIHAKEGPDGCGTARHCVTCGAVNAILECQRQNKKLARECRILVETPDGPAPMDLRVTASPFRVEGERFTVAAMEDISHPKRLAVLHRAFFHDVLNTAGCIRGYAQCLTEVAFGDENDAEIPPRIADLTEQLIEAIQNQRDLTHAEAGEMKIDRAEVRVPAVVDSLRLQYRRHPVAADRDIRLSGQWEGTIVTDRQILMRVLGNMLKNALEATEPGGTVTIGCREDGGSAVFFVHNASVMPEEVQLQVFQRSFSTKGQAGRGVGTYSMKLFGERYLGGRVEFVSRAPEGTTFTLALPIPGPAPAARHP